MRGNGREPRRRHGEMVGNSKAERVGVEERAVKGLI